MVVRTKETYENNATEAIVDNNNTLWLHEKHIEREIDHRNLPVITRKCLQVTENTLHKK